MNITIRQLSGRNALRKYVQFAIDLYKGNPYYVPALVMDELDMFSPKKNPAFEHCEAVHYMAYDGKRPVGRITGIINHKLNELSGKKEARFGFVDFIDDAAVSDALFDAVEAWAAEQGMTSLTGPLGFTDMDPEGMLVEGFDRLGTMATIYNYPYYPAHMARRGYVQDCEWVEYFCTVPAEMSAKHARVAEIVRRKFGLRSVVKDFKNINDLARKYGRQLFELINFAYKDLYGYCPLTARQIDHYLKMYIPIVRLSQISVIVNDKDEVVGVGIAMPSMSRALQQSGGRMFPFGFRHLLRGLKGRNDVADLLLVAIHPDYQGLGANALLFDDILPGFIQEGFKYVETNPELVANERVQQQWQYFEHHRHKRRVAFVKEL